MYLYNSATHKKEEFKTHTPNHVEMYTCGPTVYHFAHIGNLRSYIMEDVLEKYLRYAQQSGILDTYWKAEYGVSFIEYLKILKLR